MSDSLSNKELINIGHQFAKAMSSSTPIIDIAKMLTRLAERLDEQTALVELLRDGKFSLPDMNDDLLEILGRPNFMCSPLAECLRVDGIEIRRKSECEQAAVIRWMLNLYLLHGAEWRDAANTDLQRIKAAVDANQPSEARS